MKTTITKSILISTLCLAGISNVNSQITVTYANAPTIGRQTINGVDTGAISVNIGNPGTNQVWNLVMQNDTQDTMVMTSPSQAPCGSDFPTANIAFESDGAFFANIHSSGVDIVGSCQPFISNLVSIPFTPPLKTLAFPSSYLSTYSGSSKWGFITFYGQNGIDSLELRNVTDYTSTIDGWGTVTTPAKSNVNCLRQKVVETATDSLFGKGPNTGNVWALINNDLTVSNNYKWLTNSMDFILAEIKTNAAGDTVTEANYLISNTVYVNNNDLQNVSNDVSIYPNPSTGIFQFDSKENINLIKVINMIGSEVYNESSKGNGIKTVDLSHLPIGTYVMQIGNDKNLVTKKIEIKK